MRYILICAVCFIVVVVGLYIFTSEEQILETQYAYPQPDEFIALQIVLDYESDSAWANLLTSSGAKKIREIVVIINNKEKEFTLKEFMNKLGFGD